MELLLYCNQLQLSTIDALYSDGLRYPPAIIFFEQIKKELPKVKNFLILGAGLGSTKSILNKKGYYPNITLVDIDAEILQWMAEFTKVKNDSTIDCVCADAKDFISQNAKKYDLIFIDIFYGRIVPEFVTSIQFLSNCLNSLKVNGMVGFNYIVYNEDQWENDLNTFKSIFPNTRVYNFETNRILIAQKLNN